MSLLEVEEIQAKGRAIRGIVGHPLGTRPMAKPMNVHRSLAHVGTYDGHFQDAGLVEYWAGMLEV